MEQTTNNKKMVIALVALAVALVVIAAVALRYTHAPLAPTQTIIAEFHNEAANETVSVVFDTVANTATLTGAGYTDMLFTQTVSASGARYEHAETGMILWNKGDDVTLYDAAGTVLWTSEQQDATTVQEETPNRVETRWIWERTEMNDDTVILPAKEEAFTLIVRTSEEGAAFSGTTDCNSFSGGYTKDEHGVITFGPVASTRMFCEGSQEAAYIEALTSSTGIYTPDENTTVFLLPYDSGSMIFKKI